MFSFNYPTPHPCLLKNETWSFSLQVGRYSRSLELISRIHVSNNSNSVNHGIYQQFTRHSSIAIQCKFIQHKYQGGARILTRKSPRHLTICDPAPSSHLPGSWGKHKRGICHISHTHHIMKQNDGYFWRILFQDKTRIHGSWQSYWIIKCCIFSFLLSSYFASGVRISPFKCIRTWCVLIINCLPKTHQRVRRIAQVFPITQAFKQFETFLQLLDVAAVACKSWLHVKMVKTTKWLHVNGELVTFQEAGACKLCSVWLQLRGSSPTCEPTQPKSAQLF